MTRSSNSGASARGRFSRLGALCALLAVVMAAAIPGMALAARGPAAPPGIYICHAAGPAEDAPDLPRPETCCLLCQTAQLADGGMLPAQWALAPPSECRVRLYDAVRGAGRGEARRHVQARAPPGN